MKLLAKYLLDVFVPKTDIKQLIILSDDWGSVRMRSKKDQDELSGKGFKITNRFDQYDALETNEDLEMLFEVLTQHKDHKGNHPVVTAVTNVGNPDFKKIEDLDFQVYHYESIESTYQRYDNSDRVLDLIRKGIDENIFIPQSHGREHLQINWWMDELKHRDSYARNYFDNEFFFLGPKYLKQAKRGRGIGAAFDVWDKRDIDTHKHVIQTGLQAFYQLYGYRSSIFTPPAMFYNTVIEKDLAILGIEWLDVGRYFKTPQVGGGEKCQINYLGRKKKSGLRVMVRNGMFEPNISEIDNGVARAMNDIDVAFKAHQPAILSNHRAAFVGRIDLKNRDKSLNALDELLKNILQKWPNVEFISALHISKTANQ